MYHSPLKTYWLKILSNKTITPAKARAFNKAVTKFKKTYPNWRDASVI